MVPIMFWTIFFINRDYIYPIIFEEVIPEWQNHVVHTLPIFGVLAESLLKKHYYRPFLIGIIPIVIVSMAYITW